MKQIHTLHYLTQDLPAYSHVELAEKACSAGVKWVQLRVKEKSVEQWKRIAKEAKNVCRLYGAKLIINDNLEIALESKADGVHLGLKDMPIDRARKILGDGFIIGGTANTAQEVELQLKRGADYIGLGPFRFTSTKENLAPELGAEGLCAITEKFPSIPIIAIGGVTLEDLGEIKKTGVHGVAVSSAINEKTGPITAAQEFVKACKNWRAK